ncbi:MAG TPA: hypothetical protein VGD80_30025, partial [Kofleriaceae bacterium]
MEAYRLLAHEVILGLELPTDARFLVEYGAPGWIAVIGARADQEVIELALRLQEPRAQLGDPLVDARDSLINVLGDRFRRWALSARTSRRDGLHDIRVVVAPTVLPPLGLELVVELAHSLVGDAEHARHIAARHRVRVDRHGDHIAERLVI